MPIYEYECKSCGVHFDRKQRWQDEPVKECPECRGQVRKVLQPVGIVFKGPGFYKTDNRSSGERQERKKSEEGTTSGGDATAKAPTGPDSQASAKGESKRESVAESKAESKTETKAEPKAETKGDTKGYSKSGESN